jgi:hypothetical protein
MEEVSFGERFLVYVRARFRPLAKDEKSNDVVSKKSAAE